MGAKQKALDSVIKLLKMCINTLGERRAGLISAQLTEELAPTVRQNTVFGMLHFFCPGRLPEHRVRTLFTKEPETIAWINTFSSKDILWDIGANIGLYSLYAALRGLTVLSFEPSPSNYYLLSRNIEINKMDDRISALCVAFNDVSGLNSFYMANTDLGGALNSFAEPIDWQGNVFAPSLRQAMIGFSIDDFIAQFAPPFPNHIKIDVDGIEGKIIRGARKTLSDRKLKSLLVELDSSREDYCSNVIEIVENAGMKLEARKHASIFDTGQFSSLYNYIFVRSEK